ncbi:MAG TPA: formyltetrahydrofolate deformylase [Hanamia sp.]|nr:formyltetrahydrofolate deformylase [Hanamia sp.]
MQPSHTHILLINCPDESGLIFKVSKIVYDHNLNVVSNGEFVERKFNHFFMRTEFSGDFNKEILLKEVKNVLPQKAEIKLTANSKKNIVILATKEYHCLSDLLLRHKFDDLNINIIGVISNYEHLQELTSKFEIPYYFVDHSDKSREIHEQKILAIIRQLNPDFLVLAKYMRILSPSFVQNYNNRIINIHHSFLPAFAGANPYQKAYERGVKIIGATAHFVNEMLDEGPIIAQNVIPVDHTHDAKEMARSGRDIEKNVLAHALRLVCNEKVFVFKNKTIIFD